MTGLNCRLISPESARGRGERGANLLVGRGARGVDLLGGREARGARQRHLCDPVHAAPPCFVAVGPGVEHFRLMGNLAAYVSVLQRVAPGPGDAPGAAEVGKRLISSEWH